MAKTTVRVNLNISPEASDKLEELVKVLGATKTAVIELAIGRLYESKDFINSNDK